MAQTGRRNDLEVIIIVITAPGKVINPRLWSVRLVVEPRLGPSHVRHTSPLGNPSTVRNSARDLRPPAPRRLAGASN